MRRLLLIIVLALFANAYDAGTHVFGANLSPQPMEKMAKMDCCPPKDTKSKPTMMSCNYCCAALLACVYPFSLQAANVYERYGVMTSPDVADATLDTLFRPPRLS